MRYFFFLIAISGLFASCTQHYFYSPNTLHLPTVRERGDMTAEVSLNGSNQIKGVEVKAAWCPVEKTSVMVNYMHLQGSFNRSTIFTFPPPPSEQHSGRGYLAELGITRHFIIDQYRMFTLTAGGSIGRSVNDYDLNRLAELNFNRIFLQPAFISQGEMADFGIGLRFSRLGFYNGSIDYRIAEDDLISIQKIDASDPFWIPDLGLSAGINFSPVHLKCNLVLSVYDKNDEYSFSGNNLSVSLLFDVDNMIKKKTSTPGKKKKKKKRRH
jgi:hypothetical protein